MEEAVAAPVASESSTPIGRTTRKVVAPNPVKQKLTNPALIPLNTTSAFQPFTILASRGNSTAAAKKKVE